MSKLLMPIVTMLLSTFVGLPKGRISVDDEPHVFDGPTGGSVPLEFSSDFYGPFQEFEQNAPDFVLYIERKSSNSEYDSLTIHTQLYTLKNDDLALTRYARNRTFGSSKKMTVRIPLLLNQFLSKEGIRVVIEITSDATNYYNRKFYFRLFPHENRKVYNLKDYSEKKLELDTYVVQIQDSRIVLPWETYSFSEFRDYFLLDNYYALRLNQFHFSYSFPYNFMYSGASMTIKNAPNCFSRLKKNGSDDCVIPLSIAMNEDQQIILRYQSGLYVNKDTLEMSFSPVNDKYVPTNTFFLPKNHVDDVIGTTFVFLLEGCGYGDINLYFEVEFDSSRYLIGDCSNSDYCVIEGVVD